MKKITEREVVNILKKQVDNLLNYQDKYGEIFDHGHIDLSDVIDLLEVDEDNLILKVDAGLNRNFCGAITDQKLIDELKYILKGIKEYRHRHHAGSVFLQIVESNLKEVIDRVKLGTIAS